MGAIMTPCNDGNKISADTPAVEALAQMGRAKNGRMMVVQGAQLVGVVTLKDLLDFLTIKKELEKPV